MASKFAVCFIRFVSFRFVSFRFVSFRFVSFRFVVAEVDEQGDNMSERKSMYACNHAAHHRPVKSSRTKVRSLIRLTKRPIDDHDDVVTRDYEEGP
jgi:hypothetical protein